MEEAAAAAALSRAEQLGQPVLLPLLADLCTGLLLVVVVAVIVGFGGWKNAAAVVRLSGHMSRSSAGGMIRGGGTTHHSHHYAHTALAYICKYMYLPRNNNSLQRE